MKGQGAGHGSPGRRRHTLELQFEGQVVLEGLLDLPDGNLGGQFVQKRMVSFRQKKIK